ncbi:glycosyltransferase family 4 protein [bacterium]|nr:glycosyltransferase family 4 protein [bacterium]
MRVLPIAQSLAALGHDVTIVLPPWTNPKDSGQTYIDNGVKIVNVVVGKKMTACSAAAITIRMLSAVLSSHPQIIHCFKPKGFSGFVAMWTRFWQGIFRSKVRLFVDTDDWEGRGGWNDIMPYTGFQKRLFEFQEKWIPPRCDGITVASRALETLMWSLGISQEKILYLPNAVNNQEIPKPQVPREQLRQKFGLNDHPTVLLYTRFFEFDIKRLMAIIGELSKTIPSVKFLIVGKGFFGEEKKLASFVEERKLNDKVIIAGWVESDMISSYLLCGDVAIYPMDDTLINRTKCPVKLTEIMKFGLPVVADCVGQTGEYIRHGESGILIEPSDTGSFIKAVEHLVTNREMQVQIGKSARERMARKFSWQQWVEKLDNFYGM